MTDKPEQVIVTIDEWTKLRNAASFWRYTAFAGWMLWVVALVGIITT